MIVAAVPALRLSRRFGTSLRGGEEKALAAVAANRNNPTFKNRRSPKETKEKTFSNRNKNTCFGLPYFRYDKKRGRLPKRLPRRWLTPGPQHLPRPGLTIHRIDFQRRVGDNSRRERATAAPEGIE